MTKKSMITQSELQRMARVAKSEGVEVWVEIDGKRYGVSPAVQIVQSDNAQPEEFKSLTEWKAWRERERAREEAPKRRIGDLLYKNAEEQTYATEEPLKGKGGYPIINDPSHPLKQYYDGLGFDPRTMNSDDMSRLANENRARWKAWIPSTKIGKREQSALSKLSRSGLGCPSDRAS